MELISNIFENIIHLDRHLDVVINVLGNWSYLLIFVIVFCETGLVVTPFLPGDSLLFVVGAVSAKGDFDLFWVFLILSGAAIIGDSVNYSFGKIFGKRILLRSSHRLIKKEHIDRTHKFFEKYGGKTIIIARFVPVVRTFAPFVAGIGSMSYYKFFIYNVSGALLWVAIFVFGGYYFGNIPLIKENFLITILAMMLVSFLPIVIEVCRHRKSKKESLSQGSTISQVESELP
ncbi:MAG: DedA family protein [Candidatus Omnitrophota bacterium]|nr:DedA family protein [Candidatus Omnitrophota bacterium]